MSGWTPDSGIRTELRERRGVGKERYKAEAVVDVSLSTYYP